MLPRKHDPDEHMENGTTHKKEKPKSNKAVTQMRKG